MPVFYQNRPPIKTPESGGGDDRAHPRIVQVRLYVMGAARRCSPDPHFAGTPDRFLTLAHSARLCVRVSKIHRTRESALVRHRLSAPLAAHMRGTKPPGRADVRTRGLSAVRHGCGEAYSLRWAYAEAKARDSVDCLRAMPPGPPKSGSVAASDGKAASTRFVEGARFADAPCACRRQQIFVNCKSGESIF